MYKYKQFFATSVACTVSGLSVVAPISSGFASPPKQVSPRQHKTEIGLIIKGHLLVQPVEGGTLRRATPDEKKEWNNAKPDETPNSPNASTYFIHTEYLGKDGPAIEYKGKVIVKSGWLKKIVPENNIAGAIPTQLEGWMPDERHFAMFNSVGNSSSITSSRLVVDAATGRAIPFNGWVEPTRKRGILPTGNNYKPEGTNVLYVERPGYKRGRMEKDTTGEMVEMKSFESNPSLTRYVIIPVPNPISRFRSLSEIKGVVTLTFGGKPFTFQSDDDSRGTLAHFIFSKDGKWALCTHDMRGSFLFSMVNGRGRIIPDKAARFVEPLSEEARGETDND